MPADQQKIDKAIEVLRDLFPSGHPDFVVNMARACELHSRKNADYARGGNPLGNFMRVSQILNIYPGIEKFLTTPAGVAFIYNLKQFDASAYMISQGYEGDVEGVNERIFDEVVYNNLIMILREEQCEQNPLRPILEEAIEEMEQVLDDCGDCDHSVGVCCCELKDKIARARAALYGEDPDPEGLYL